MSHRFSIGEIAILVEPHYDAAVNTLKKYIGSEVGVVKLPTINPWGIEFYEVVASDGHAFLATEASLRKRRPPEQPADDDFQDWLKTITDPLEETMRKVHPSLAEVNGTTRSGEG